MSYELLRQTKSYTVAQYLADLGFHKTPIGTYSDGAHVIYKTDASTWRAGVLATGKQHDFKSVDEALDWLTREEVIELLGPDVIRGEVCCEDAVNVLAYHAYQALFGRTPMHEMDHDEVDTLLGMAREYVKSHVKWVDYEWEEF